MIADEEVTGGNDANYSESESTATTESSEVKSPMVDSPTNKRSSRAAENLSEAPLPKKSPNENSSSDSGKLHDYYENQIRHNIFNAFAALKRDTVAKDQV